MKQFFQRVAVGVAAVVLALTVNAQQLTNANFDDWSGAAFDGNPQPKGWNASHVEQVGLKFNFAHKETGHNGGYCLMVQDQDVGAMGITETSPGYFSLGQPWAYLPSITAINQATAGTYGGIDFKYRPDSMSVWIRRTGSNWDKEDFYLLYYAWTGVAKGEKYKGKNGSCTSYSCTDEESDIRQALNGNECGTAQKVTQVSEGMWRERATYSNWVNIKVPILYFNNTAPTRMNIIFSASNYPNFRANSGLYTGNSLYVDDVELIYSSKIQKLIVDEIEWRGFDPNSEEVQVYALGQNATAVPDIVAMRGAGSITNAHGTTVSFPGRQLQGNEISIEKGDLSSKPTIITVKSEDGKSQTVYKIQFQKAASSNAKLAAINYKYTDKDGKEIEEPVPGFSPSSYDYKVGLPYGTTKAPTISVVTQEDGQKVELTQAQSVTGTAKAVVTAANNTTKLTYNVTFSVAALDDNTLKDIKVNGKSILGFSPVQTVYKVSLPVGTNKMTVEAVSAYKAGEQTITYSPSQTLEGAAIDGATVQISVTTPGNPVAKVYKLNCKCEASSYSYLSDLKVEGDQIQSVNPSKTDNPKVLDFVPEYLTYYVNLKMGTKALPKITAVKGDEYQKEPVISSLGEGVVDGTVRITVTAGNGDQTVYKIIFATEKSEISTLQGINIDGKALDGFKPDVTTYSYTLPVGTTKMPTIEPVPGDEFQTINVTEGGINGKTRISVTAQNGSTTIYQITFSVATYSNNTLAGLYFDSKLVDGFAPEKEEYWINLDKNTDVNGLKDRVTFKLQDTKLQKASDPKFTGSNGEYTYRVTVRPDNGESRTYTIHFTIAKANNTTLAMIYIDNKKLEGFDPNKTEYKYSLPEGVSTIPAVTFDKGDDSQRVHSVLDKNVRRITVTAESGDKREYTITFIITVSNNSQLEMIYLDGVKLDKFQKDVLEYEKQLAVEKCPTITVDKAPGQQVTITAPYGYGEASIVVKSEGGSSNTYKIKFVPVEATSAQLKAILINGTPKLDFKPTKFDYSYEYERTWPTVGYVKDYDEQHVDSLWQGNVLWLYVRDSLNNTNGYYITFTKKPLSNNSLSAILIDGKQMQEPKFDPKVTDYNIDLPAGSSYPTVSYEKGDETQTVFLGQVAEGKWQITVQAENGQQKTYNVNIVVKPYADATLKSLSVEGYTFEFDSSKVNYEFELEAGLPLPAVSYKTREGQVVLEHDSINATLIHVTAQNGEYTTYRIKYTRTGSSNAYLADLLVDGKTIPGFAPEKLSYTYELEEGTEVIPDVFPVAALNNQTITTELSRPRSKTKITVEAEGGAKNVYIISFPVIEAKSTRLGSLTINGEERDVETFDYEFNVPYGTLEPYKIEYTKAEKAQLIEFIQAPITGTTKIVVTNSFGEKGTYSIRYNVGQAEGANILKKIKYSYKTADDELHEGEITNPKKGDNKVDLPFGCKDFKVTDVEKNYLGQTVIRYDGSIRRSAKLIVVPNRIGEEDVTYTVTPSMPAFDTTGKLKTLQFQGEELPNWRSDVYNYLINVTAEPVVEDFAYTAFDGKAVKILGVPEEDDETKIDAVKKQIRFKVEDGETYSVCWFYENDGKYKKNVEDENYIDYLDFSSGNWEKAKYNGYHPHGFVVPGDCADSYDWKITWPLPKTDLISMTFTTGKEAMAGGANGALLSTTRGSSLNGSIPGMMTMGKMSVTLGSTGSSTSSMTYDKTTGVQFRNTPEQLAFEATPLSVLNISEWYCNLTITDGTKVKNIKKTGGYSPINIKQYPVIDIDYSSIDAISKYTLTLNAAEYDDANKYGHGALDGTVEESTILLENFHFVYNSTLTNFFVDGKEILDRVEDTLYYELGDDVELFAAPSLTFVQEVHDQMQVIEWLHDGEWLNGQLTAKVTNYGENMIDKTEYYVVIKRKEAFISLDFAVQKNGSPMTLTADTTMIDIPFGTTVLPDLEIVPQNAHQRFTVEKNGNFVKITVKAENEAEKTKVVVYRENKSKVATLEEIKPKDEELELDPYFDPNIFAYQIVASAMPEIECKKGSSGQTVDLNYGYYDATITVTAESGDKKTYTITLIESSGATTAQINTFNFDGVKMTDFGGDDIEIDHERPNYVSFVRDNDKDSVCFTQTPTGMTWKVTHTEAITTTYTLNYPTASSNTKLGNILLNGEDYSEFDPDDDNDTYDVISDATVWFEAIAAEEGQKLSTEQSLTGDTVVYTITVTAQDGETQKPYFLRVSKPKSLSSELAGILVDGELIAGFRPDSLVYTVVLPSVGAKREEPQMPSLTYVLGQAGQTVNVSTGDLNGKATTFNVHAAAGSSITSYEVTVTPEKSHYTELSGIILNGAALEGFEPGRHYYSVSLHDSKFTFDYTTDDLFQTVTSSLDQITLEREYTQKFHVVAEDGSASDYLVQVYVENPSSDSQLANIKLNNQELSDFERELNAKSPLKFEPSLTLYDIIRPSSMTVLPEVSAQLKMAGQQVSIEHVADTIFIHVTAPNGTSKSTYRLNFMTYLSQNAQLKMIYQDGNELVGFEKDKYVYFVQLPEGIHEYPDVSWQEDESVQSISAAWDKKNDQVQITVQAEDKNVSNIYSLIFAFTRSAADTLKAIRADGEKLAGFEPHKFHYTDSLEVGTRAFPDLSWDEVNEWQTITLDTVSLSPDGSQLTRSITVIAENGRSNTYLVTYVIRKSAVNTLKQLIVDKTQLKEFNPTTLEYNYTLTAARAAELGGKVPEVEYIEGDEYQTILVSQAPDALSGKSLGLKSLVTVTAANGSSRTYTVHYPVEMSADATLNMILLGGKPLPNFDSERFSYTKIEIDKDAAIPVVSVVKKEDAQTYEIRVDADTVQVQVWAEDTKVTTTYTLVFERLLSSYSMLKDIILRDEAGNKFPTSSFPFRYDEFEYTGIVLPYDPDKKLEDVLPSMEFVRFEATQTVDTAHYVLANGDIRVVVTVTAANGVDQSEYTLEFTWTRPADALLLNLFIDGQELTGFNPLVTEYSYVLPFGSTEENFLKPENITYKLSDERATAEVTAEGTTIKITVTAQDGTTKKTYFIFQSIAPDTNNDLLFIVIGTDTLENFDPKVTEYSYTLLSGATVPEITAKPVSPNASVTVQAASAAGDTCTIVVLAADGTSKKYYYIYFREGFNDGLEPTANDVLLKRVLGAYEMFAATIRKGVTISLFDQNGRLVFNSPVPVADANYVDLYRDAMDKDVLVDVMSYGAGLRIPVIQGQIYFYSFYGSGEKIIKSGKFVAL